MVGKNTRFRPWLIAPGGPLEFPDPRRADGEAGLVAIGGDLSVARMLHAYAHGVFPWYDSDTPILWWSPQPRAVLRPCDLHVSRSLARRLRRGQFEISIDRAFGEVVSGCADRAGGTWIVPEMARAYLALRAAGHAHSVEVWTDGRLVGGLYGVRLGGLFAAESMFHRHTDASKAALVAAVRSLSRIGVNLVDVQFLTPHLASMGARCISREAYLDQLAQVVKKRINIEQLQVWLEPES